jgi:branched-chain amino acid transport system permease protein
MGSLPGAIVAGLLIGEIVSLTSYFQPKLAEIVIFLVMALVLLVRPSGLFGERGLAQ